MGLDGSAADEDGGAELSSAAPLDVSAVPDEGFMAFLRAGRSVLTAGWRGLASLDLEGLFE